jgi:hypothetical protein
VGNGVRKAQADGGIPSSYLTLPGAGWVQNFWNKKTLHRIFIRVIYISLNLRKWLSWELGGEREWAKSVLGDSKPRKWVEQISMSGHGHPTSPDPLNPAMHWLISQLSWSIALWLQTAATGKEEESPVQFPLGFNRLFRQSCLCFR